LLKTSVLNGIPSEFSGVPTRLLSKFVMLFISTRVFKHAERINAGRLILVGKSEWERGMVRVKILSTREEFEVKAGELQ
jgi:hypothetical protein